MSVYMPVGVGPSTAHRCNPSGLGNGAPGAMLALTLFVFFQAMVLAQTTGPASSKVEVESISFETPGCSLAGSGLSCSVLITNLDQDQQLSIFARQVMNAYTRLVDSNGNEYNATAILSGSQVMSVWPLKLVSGVPMRIRVLFEEVPRDLVSIRLLEVFCRAQAVNRLSDARNFSAKLRGITVLRSQPSQPTSAKLPPSISSPVAPSAISKVEVGGLSFEASSCSLTGRLSCSVLITSLDEDRTLRIYQQGVLHTRVIDDRGNEYTVTNIRFGNQASTSPSIKLIVNVPVNVVFEFENVSPDIAIVNLLEIGYYTAPVNSPLAQRPFSAQLRAVAISRTTRPQR